MAKKITNTEVNKVLESCLWFGQNITQAGKAAGINRQTASCIVDIARRMRTGDIKGLEQEAATNEKITANMVTLVAERLGMEAPNELIHVILDRQRKKTEKYRNARAGQAAAPVEETPSAGPHPSAALTLSPCAGKAVEAPAEPKGNDAVYFIRILEELHQQNEYLKDLLDVVLPKYVSDLKDNLNANADVIGQDLRGCLEELKAIRCNTRKRGL